MGDLSRRDLAVALDVVRVAYAFDGLDGFRAGVLGELRRVIPGEQFGYNSVDIPAGRAIIVVDPSDAVFVGSEEAFTATAHEHPGVIRSQLGDYRPHTLSDFLTVRGLQRLDLYNEVYRHLGAEDQIYFHLAPPAIVTLAINRSTRSFSTRDRAMIDLLEPHLSQAYVQAVERDRARALIAAQQAGLQESEAAVIVLDAIGLVVHASALARDLLQEYYPEHRTAGRFLPDELSDWLRSAHPDVARTHCRKGPDGSLHVRLLSGSIGDGWRAVLIDERPSDPVRSPESLRRLGLTDRQVQVLRQLARGQSNTEIAHALHLSPATVRKHLENIYARLGVRSRTEAVAIALHGAGAK
jgi:DNA-binding CsgD family transcriptional regulator